MFDHRNMYRPTFNGSTYNSEGGPLPEEITQLIDEAWAKIKGGISHYAF